MRGTGLHLAMAAGLVSAVITHPSSAQTYPTPLAEEPIPNVRVLPDRYPASWIIVHDFNFHALIDGRGVVVDASSPTAPLKGWVQVAQFGNILHASHKPELYSAETYFSRLARGERTDVITIWDKATLRSKGEILLPGGKRQQSVTYKNSFQFTNGEAWALVSNFTPAQSVTVVDLEHRKILGEIELPGCALIYPTGQRGFTTFCADGTMTSLVLDAEGKVASTVTSKPVHDIDNQPMFGMPALVGRTAWFVTYRGQLKAFDLSGQVAKEVGGFSLAGEREGADPEWRPGGWQVIASSAAGHLYVLMNPAGREGSHKDGGTEVWVVDPAKKARISRIRLQGVGSSIELTQEPQPKLVVARVDSVIDVYDATSGAFLHSLGTRVAFNPQTLTAVK